MPDWLVNYVREGGGYCAVLELLAIGWLLKEHARLTRENKELDARVFDLAKVIITISTELRMFLFNERKG